MKSLVIGYQPWWAVEDSNLRPPRCQRLSNLQVFDFYRLDFMKIGDILTKLRKTAQVIKRKLRPLKELLKDCSSGTRLQRSD